MNKTDTLECVKKCGAASLRAILDGLREEQIHIRSITSFEGAVALLEQKDATPRALADRWLAFGGLIAAANSLLTSSSPNVAAAATAVVAVCTAASKKRGGENAVEVPVAKRRRNASKAAPVEQQQAAPVQQQQAAPVQQQQAAPAEQQQAAPVQQQQAAPAEQQLLSDAEWIFASQEARKQNGERLKAVLAEHNRQWMSVDAKAQAEKAAGRKALAHSAAERLAAATALLQQAQRDEEAWRETERAIQNKHILEMHTYRDKQRKELLAINDRKSAAMLAVRLATIELDSYLF